MRSDVLRKLVALGIVLTPMATLLPACDQAEDEAVVAPEPEEPAGTTETSPGGTTGGTTGTEDTGAPAPEQEY